MKKLPPADYIKIPPLNLPEIPDTSEIENFICKIKMKIHAEVLNAFDKAATLAIQDYCRKNGYTDLMLIDEAFIRDAIEHEIQRRPLMVNNQREHIADLEKIAEFYRIEAEKNLQKLNEARSLVWHSISDELPSEKGTYLVVGKSGTVYTAHFYPERKIPSTEYAIVSAHFSNRHVRFWAKLPKPPAAAMEIYKNF